MIKKKRSPRHQGSAKADAVQWEKAIARASSRPLSVGAQILLHYLSSSADNSYSPGYVRSVLSLTSALMLFNMAHSLSGLEWTLAALCQFSLSLYLSTALACAFCHFYIHALIHVTQWHAKIHPLWSGFFCDFKSEMVAVSTSSTKSPAVRQKLHTACSYWQIPSLIL